MISRTFGSAVNAPKIPDFPKFKTARMPTAQILQLTAPSFA